MTDRKQVLGTCPKCGIEFSDDRVWSEDGKIIKGFLKVVDRKLFEEKCDGLHIAGEECLYWQQPELMKETPTNH